METEKIVLAHTARATEALTPEFCSRRIKKIGNLHLQHHSSLITHSLAVGSAR